MTYAAIEWIVVFGVVGTAAALMVREVSGWMNAGRAPKNGHGRSPSGSCGSCASGCNRSPESVPMVALVPLNLDIASQHKPGD